MNPNRRTDRLMWALTALVTLAVLLGLTIEAHAHEPSVWERQIVEKALRSCKRNTDPWMLLDILRAEESAGLPPHMRGIVLATAIGEAACNPRALNEGENAQGLTQIRPRWWSCAGDLYHPLANVRCWLARVVKLAHGKARRRCPGQAWEAAEAWTSQGWSHPRWPVDWYCKAITGHMVRLRIWQARGLGLP